VKNVEGLKSVGMKADAYETQIDIIREISEHIHVIKTGTDKMIEERKKANKIEDHRARAVAYCDKVRPYFDEIRYHVDKLELLVDDAYWPLPKYREMLSMR
jgi:glutamine synthetase